MNYYVLLNEKYIITPFNRLISCETSSNKSEAIEYTKEQAEFIKSRWSSQSIQITFKEVI